jgi:hypothetical protein
LKLPAREPEFDQAVRLNAYAFAPANQGFASLSITNNILDNIAVEDQRADPRRIRCAVREVQKAVDSGGEVNNRQARLPDPRLDIFGIALPGVLQNQLLHCIDREPFHPRREFRCLPKVHLMEERISHPGGHHAVAQAALQLPQASVDVRCRLQEIDWS